MEFCKSTVLEVVRQQLAIDINSKVQDFLENGVVFCEAKMNKGRRMFKRQKPYLEVTTMGKSIVVSADKYILKKVKPLFKNKDREDIFVAPFLFGHSLYYIPDSERIKKYACPEGFSLLVKEGKEIHKLYDVKGFENAIQYDINHPCPDVLVTYLMKENRIVGMAGASADCKTMWQIGIDVVENYRGMGIATCLVSNLALMIMERGIVPYYGTASSNIPSQLVAYRSGFIPAWMCSYGNIFDGKAPYENDIEIIIS